MKLIIKPIILILICIHVVSSQSWINNDLTDYFKDKYVKNFAIVDSVIWINGVGLTKYNGHKFTTYNLTPYSEGPLDSYISDKGSGIFDRVINYGNSIYLYDTGDRVILRIENDFVYKYSENVLDGLFKDVSIDEDKNIWLLMKESKHFESKFKVYTISKNSKTKYPLPDKYENYKIAKFFINQGYKYIFLHMPKDNCTENLLLVVNNTEEIKEFTLNPYYREYYSYRHFCLSNKVYIMSGEGDVYIVTYGTNMESFIIPNCKGYNEYSFVVKGQYIYCYTGNFRLNTPFFKYDLDNKIMTLLPLQDNPPNQLDRKKSFLNIEIYKDMLIGRDGNYEGGNGILLFKD